MERRHPKACELVVTTDDGQRLAVSGRLAEVVAAVVVELLADPRAATAAVWHADVDVTQKQILVRVAVTRAPIRFRDHSQQEAS